MTNTERTWMEVQMVMSHVAGRSGRLQGDRGEGVISTAIAVLIDPWVAVLLGGLLVALGGLGAERAIARR